MMRTPVAVASRAACALGESPLWHPAESRLYWIDIPGRTLWRLDPRTGEESSWALPQEPGCIGLVAAAGHDDTAAVERLVIALRSGFHLAAISGATIALERIAPASYDTTRFRFNDGKVDPEGRFWAGTLFEPKTVAAAGLYRLVGNQARAITGPEAGEFPWSQWGVTTSNGLAFSPDGRTLYQSDTPAHVIYACDRDPARGIPLNRRVWWRTGDDKSSPDYGGRPDGAAVDVDGGYWSAMYEGGRIVQISPAGELLRSIPIPARCPTMVAFGDDDLSTLYVTTARAGRPQDELDRLPDSGRVFALRVPVPGLPSNRYRAA